MPIHTTTQLCPQCSAFAQLNWFDAAYGIFGAEGLNGRGTTLYSPARLNHWRVAICVHCEKPSIWDGKGIIWPCRTEAPRPHPELPEDVIADYNEAAEIVSASPRGAAALLRLALEKLCAHLSPGPDKINGAIKRLVAKGLQAEVQQSLDVVRVVGNHAVHPGHLDLKDDHDTVMIMFDLLNLIATRMIEEPRKAHEIYSRLPQDAREAIERRDAAKP